MKRYKSPLLKHIHEEAKSLLGVGAISAKRMKEYDDACLVQAKKASKADQAEPTAVCPDSVYNVKTTGAKHTAW